MRKSQCQMPMMWITLLAMLNIASCTYTAAEERDAAWTFNVDGSLWDSAVEEDTAYVGASDGFVYALSIDSGDVRWKTELGLQVYSRPALINGELLIAGCRGEPFNPNSYQDGQLVSLSQADGTIQWRKDLDGAFQARAYAQDGIAAASAGPYVYGVDQDTGRIRWAYKHGTGMVAGVALANEAVVVQGVDGRILAFDPVTGDERWTASAQTRSVSFPVAHGSTVFTGDLGGTMTARNLADGEPVWSITTSGGLEGRCAAVGGNLLFTNREAQVFCVDTKTGETRWEKQYRVAGKNSSQFGGLDASDTRLALSALEQGVFVLDLGTGNELANIHAEGALALVSVTDEMVLFSSLRSNQLSAVPVSDQ
jgi:eukaryotic-like serine/threonine-protein kinase